MTAAATKTRPAPKRTPAKKRTPAPPVMQSASGQPPGGDQAAPPAATPDPSAVHLLQLALLDDHPDNPPGRSVPDEDLIASVRSVGLLQPLLVTPGIDGRFTIIAGHRRRAALVQAGRTEALCQVRSDLTGALVDIAMAVENGRRKGLGALEEASLYARLRDRDGLSQRAIAVKVGVDQSHVSRLLSLLRLPESARAAVALEQVAVQDAAQLAQFAGHPEAFETAWHSLTTYGHVQRARERGQAMVEKTKRKAELLAAGVKVIEPSEERGSKYAAGYTLDISEAKHAKLGCHVVVLYDSGGSSWLCDKPASHPKPKWASTSSGAADAKAREDARERKKAMKARAEAARVAEGWPISPAAAAPVLARALAGRQSHNEAMTLAIAWLQANGAGGFDKDATPYEAERQILEHGDDRLVVRYGCALALAAQECRARDSYGRWGREQALYVHRLVRDGQYSPTEWERRRLTDGAKVTDVDAFLAAEDPTPYLPGQPSQQIDLGQEAQQLDDGVTPAAGAAS